MKGSIRFNDAVNAEVTTDGTDITKVVNVATGEEYGGGGGTYSTAHVTFEFTDVGNGQPVIVYGLKELYGDIVFNPSNPQWDHMALSINRIFEQSTTTPVIDIPFIPGKSAQLMLSNLNGSTDIGGEFFIDRENPVITVSGAGTVADLSEWLVEITGDCTIHVNTIYD